MSLKKLLSVGLLAVLLMGVAAFAFPAGSVAAQSSTPPPKDPQARINLANFRLERMLRLERATLNRITRHFNQLDQFIRRAGTLITRAKENGKDVSALEAAVVEFRAVEGDARLVLDEVKALLASPAGFDANGKVTDRETAKATLEEVHTKFQDIRSTIGDGARNLHEAFKSWREANPPQDNP